MGKLLKTAKGKLIALICGGSIVATGAVITLFLLKGEESYRTISVEEVNGTTIVVNEQNKNTEAYQGMHLYPGDDVTVQQKADMTLLLDMDKYVYAEENTHFWLEATGNDSKNSTVIHLEEGAVLNRIENKLEDGSVYEVDTPNSTMSIRGTVFRVVVFVGEDGLTYAFLEVFEGSVQVELKDLQGNYNGVTETFHEGEAAKIRADMDFSEFIVSEDGSIIHEIGYRELPLGTVYALLDYIDDGEELCIGKDLLKDYTGLEEHKWEKVTIREATCSLEGEEGLVCSVCQETSEVTTIPKLSHTEGDWETVAEATCEEPGEQNKVCIVCGEILETRETEALGHTMGDWTVTKEATCDTAGSRSRSCTVCDGATETRVIEALGHTMGDWIVTKEATCVTAGSESRSCTVCGKAETRDIAATGHTMSAWQVIIGASCEAAGSQSRSCTVCGAKETQEIAPTGHTYVLNGHEVTDEVVDNSSVATAYYACTICQKTKTEQHACTVDGETWIATCGCGAVFKLEW